ncbi:MAG: L-serine ammonia-lyase, iron-sulfur-dependent, subunit alpha [Spirochaetaceae bacterium]|nr:L-serine ammonia-lyase, iron-sulfur-dependent, subunit alpha [Spirochaetaceae bacterium]
MQSLSKLYKKGPGPSSSHTMGVQEASKLFLKYLKGHNLADNRWVATLGKSLAATGVGHHTDCTIKEAFEKDGKKIEIKFDESYSYQNKGHKYHNHPNTLKLSAYNKEDEPVYEREYLSLGGGEVFVVGSAEKEADNIYPFRNFTAIKEHCYSHNLTLPDFVRQYEEAGSINITEYLTDIWQTMVKAIADGLSGEEKVLKGGLNYVRRAKDFYERAQFDRNKNAYLYSYALAVMEQNSIAGNVMVTAPTCGAAGVVPAVLYHYFKDEKKLPVSADNPQVIEALAVAGIVGNIAKTRASISGAVAGCQAEIGVACAMAAAALVFLRSGGKNIELIEQAAAIALKHNLGLTCDPVLGLVQEPCIERNAIKAAMAANVADYVMLRGSQAVIFSYDEVLGVMLETGKDLKEKYRETAKGGLAKCY